MYKIKQNDIGLPGLSVELESEEDIKEIIDFFKSLLSGENKLFSMYGGDYSVVFRRVFQVKKRRNDGREHR